MNAEKVLKTLALSAGIAIDDNQPANIKVLDRRFYQRILAGGSLALGESYMDGWWKSDDLEETLYLLIRSRLSRHIHRRPIPLIRLGFHNLWTRLFNLASSKRAFQVGQRHYDIGNDIYRSMLDHQLIYSCGYWRNSSNLDQAQEQKLDLICRKLNLNRGMRLLDVGCGFGGLIKFAVENYGVKARGVTVSVKQAELARQIIPAGVEISVADYRSILGQYDRVVSVGMFEHVGYKNYTAFMRLANHWLDQGGLMLVHTIGRNEPTTSGDQWITKYIFPNSMLPSIEQIDRAARSYFIMEDWHNFGPDYALTLRDWWRRFNQAWPLLRAKYDDRFFRMWQYYLLSSAAAFRARQIQLWQIVFSKNQEKTYDSVR